MGEGNIAAQAIPAPIYRRRWLIIVLLLTVFLGPLALFSVATGPVFRKSRSGDWVPVKKFSRLIYFFLALWSSWLCVQYTTHPDRIGQIWKDSADPRDAAHNH